MPFRYPVALELSGRACVVVGGGPLAEAKARGLMEAGGDVTVIAAKVTDGIDDLRRRRELEVVLRDYRAGDLEGAFLVITTDPPLNPGVFDEANARNVLCNAVDDTARCHFAIPSLVRRGELLLTVSTGGRAPALAKRLRHRLAASFGPEYGMLLDLLADLRDEARPRRTVSFSAWAKRWEAVLADEEALVALVADGHIDEARDRARRLLEDQPAALKPASTSAQRSGSLR